MSDSFIKMCDFVSRMPRKLIPAGLHVKTGKVLQVVKSFL